MLKKIVSILVLLNMLAPVANASEEEIDWEQLMQNFAQCDTTFFADINANKAKLSELVALKSINEQQTFIKVEDRTDNNKNHVMFNQPVKYKDLTIVGYYDSALNLGKYGDYYFWGFIFQDDIEKIKNSTPFLSWQNMEDRLLYIANPLIRYAEDDLNEWHINNATAVGVKTIPAAGTTEKLVLLEKGPMTSLLCSIQGFVPLELLKSERPDIKQRPNNTLN